jgi:putative spermidine/putrescine transport system permease protein
MLTPVLLVMALFAIGLTMAGAQSLGWLGLDHAAAPTFAHYRSLVDDEEIVNSMVLTLWVAGISTIVAVSGGLAIAITLARLARGRRMVYALLQVPLAVPHLAIAVALVTLIAPSGLVARIIYALGWITEPAQFPALVYDRYGLGVIAAYVAKEVPFLAVVTTVLLLRLGADYDAVARTLGATAWQRLRHVTLPLVFPGVSAAALIVFAYVFAAFETPFLLGRPYPAMLSVVAQQRYLDLDLLQRPGAVALAVLMTVFAALAARAYLALSHAAVGRDRFTVF